MENDAPTLYCPNELCQSPNPLTHKFCLRCSTAIPKRYLWVQGEGLSFATPGEILGDRYLVIDRSVVLDIRPGLVPETPELESLSVIRPYLRLIPYRVQVPQVYGVIPPIEGRSQQEILLLEKPPIFTDSTGQQVQLYPNLIAAWGNASSIRQLHWLWQLANLWQPLLSEGVATTILKPDLIRVEGTLVRLLDLHSDAGIQPSLSELGKFWQQLEQTAKPAIAEFIHKISNSLIAEEINSAEQLIAALDLGLGQLGRSQTSNIKIFTKTDTGPSRQRNEDACYPLSGTLVTKPPQSTALAIVCDGIGGHEGGNVASNLAIETIQQQVQRLTQVPADHIDPSMLLTDLESAVAVVNDKISQRNDSENRQGRQRMGTTIVMALPIGHEIYITHVGDSRAYWITRQGCYQVTLDDDVASREVRLGYALYREAIQQSGSGSLVQALGMSPSTSLHPTAQRFILDEDAVFLLTSDGLSDFDRIEDYWETEILPILKAEADIASVAEKLVEIANTKNGHDNVTIALVHYQAKYTEPDLSVTAIIPESSFAGNSTEPYPTTAQPNLVSNPNNKTKVIPDEYKQRSGFAQLPLQLIVPLMLVTIVGSLGYLVMQLRQGKPPIAATSATPNSQQNPNPSPTARSLNDINIGWVIKTTVPIPLDNKLNNLKSLPLGTVLQVTNKQFNSESGSGKFSVNLKICSQKDSPNQSKANNLDDSQSPQEIILSQEQLKKYKVSIIAENPSDLCVVSTPEQAPQPSTPIPQANDDKTSS